MKIELLIQGMAKAVMVTVFSTGLFMAAAEAQSLEDQSGDTQMPLELPGIDRGISSTSPVQVVQPAIVNASDSKDMTGKKLKDVIPSNDHEPVDQRAPLSGVGSKPAAPRLPIDQRTATPLKPKAVAPAPAELPIDQRTSTPLKPKAAAPAPAGLPIDQRTATPLKLKAAAPDAPAGLPIDQRTATLLKPKAAEAPAELPIDQRTATPLKLKAAAPDAPAELPIDQRTATPMKPKAVAPAANAELPIDQRTATPLKPKAAEAPAELPIDQRTSTPLKPKAAAPAPAELPIDQRTATSTKPHRATVVDDQPELPIDARTAHAGGKAGKGGKGGKVAAMRARRVSHHQQPSPSYDPLNCRARQEPGSIAGLQAFSQHLPEYDIENKDYDNLPQTEAPEQTTAYRGNSKFLKNLERTTLQAVRKPRVRGGRVIKDPTRAKGLCLRGVREAIQLASGKPLHGWTLSAKNAGPFLVREQGYKKARPGQYTAHNAPIGSVLIYDKPSDPRAHGHIEIRMANGYYSDFYAKYPINDPRQMGTKRRLIGIYLPPEN